MQKKKLLEDASYCVKQPVDIIFASTNELKQQ